ncbi:MAG: autotransporter-associated beta strand repeat-containing protein [Kiritimatiellae bacterium]|nr:autotransporter-associated beta strand repeat-containing protein [Kiritimatiellia bacterium]
MTNIKSGILARFHAPITRLALSLCAIGIASAAQADNYWWTGGSADTNYSTPANWGNNEVPTASDTAQFTGLSAGKTVTFDGNKSVSYVWVGETAPEQGGSYSFISDEGVANPVVLTASDPSFGIASSGAISCADGENQRGALKIVDGTHSAGACSYWGWGKNVKFNAEISGGTLKFNGANENDCLWIMYGNGVENVIDIDGGTLAVNGGDFLIGTGNDATSSTEINISNGGVLSVGTEQTERWMKLGVDGTGKITINVNEGGTLACWFITHTSTGDCELNLDGGTLKMLGATDFGNSIDPFNNDSFDVIVGENGGTLDTNGKNITISKLISGAGTLNVTGGGSVTFTVAPQCTVEPDSETEVIYPSVEPSNDYAVYAWNDIFTADFEDENTYLSGWTRSTDMAANYDRRERPGMDDQHYLAYYAYAHTNKRGTTATYEIPSDIISSITSVGAYEVELDWFATVGYSGSSDDLHSFLKAYSQDAVVAAIDAVAVYSGGKTGVDATVYKYGEVATEATVHTAPRGSDSFDASKAEYWYHVSLKATPNGVYLTVARPDGTEVVSNLFVSDYVVLTKLDFQVQSRMSTDETVAGVDNIKINVPVFSTADGETYIVAAGSQYGSDEEETIDVSAQASVIAGNTIVKKGDGALVLTGLSADSVCNVNVEDGTLVLPAGAKVGAVAVSEGAHLLVDVTGGVDGQVVFTYSSISGDVSERGLDSSATIVRNTVGETTTWTISREAKTYTWNGADGADWTVAANWLVDGEESTSMPTADDTLIFTGSASVYVPWESRSVGTVLVQSGTLTVNPGVIFASLTLENGSKLAFDMSGWDVGAVGASSDLVTVNAGNVTANDIVAPANCTGVFAGGVFTATRVVSTYTWAGTGTDWSKASSWRVNGVAVGNVPGEADTVVFPLSNEESFENWEVLLQNEVTVAKVTVNGNALVRGENAYAIRTVLIDGSAELRLSNANLRCNAADLTVSCPLNIMPDTTSTVFLGTARKEGHNAYFNGPLYGSGVLKADHVETQNVGVKFRGSVSQFFGTFTSDNYNSRDATDFLDGVDGSANAVWNVSPSHSKDTTEYLIHGASTLYRFGAFNGQFWSGNYASTIEIGGRDDVNSEFALYSHTTSGGDPRPFTITKIGAATMKITNGYGSNKIKALYLNGGMTEIKCMPTDTVQFGGGALRTPIYNIVVGKTYTYVYVNENDETDVRELDVDMGASFSEDAVVYNLTETRTSDVIGPYYPDVSSVIKDSTGPIWFDTGDADYTWASGLDSTNEGGFIKDGSGTLTLSSASSYDGPTWIKGGTIVFQQGTEVKLDPRTEGTAQNAIVRGYKYMANTVLYGNEPGSDVEGDVDVSGVVKIDISDPSFVDDFVDNRLVVLCRTTGSITGLNSKKFVQGETLLVPEKPEDVPEKRWNWAVRVMRIGDKNCLCVAPRTMPFSIKLR